ncbi:nicotinate-nucleotide diphosphorylase (carboxylating) [candidate division WOR-1 bacterium RIFOXYA2_FULL_36_21]|uniref:Probable nicotinate-nucleotide pyrophosphorylase [carboxylating] n=1 Tax=candidate division WOR-1 bacterium RIFOXYB2_FULL_36_35 TaxID=1802578 RepID=A0A1F4S3Q2_UNCSA|nr:MAG: nicotinate-nucleotide diphosphorylase (carboxylating) [candidate division WOR-1 bacterium RIFOXYA2_FULL_36_21]OGC15030.1 MAG: nicotinate-nucleotide diphosphorylase (carboxylating) [candidate division WOR-1 bacterium RIFOXYB2_FULL_36_35]OGC18742.1 MAG: nicotinate-nucleotide diphosphorylase (carboxylating) [candidate division WOR-1 bacterium RIFOXYA12_FULL_36_13]
MNKSIKSLIEMALLEDIGSRDITTDAIIDKRKPASAIILVKEDGLLAGTSLVKGVFDVLDKKIKVSFKVKDGNKVSDGEVIAEITGPAHSILKGERLALNFLQRLSGIATLTSKFVVAVTGTNVKILDTRKTTPLWRQAEKEAVLAGGGQNHRFGLYDAVLIKDNHIKFAGGIEPAIKLLRKKAKKIEVEAQNINEVKTAIKLGVDRILLDNMDKRTLMEAVKLCKNAGIETEASGGVNLKNIKFIAKTGVDYISVGALTHSAKALDISLKFV